MDFSADSSVPFSVDFGSNRQRISFKTFPKTCKTKDLRDFLKKIPKRFPYKLSLLAGSLLFTGCASLTRQAHPPIPPDSWSGWEAYHYDNAKRHADMLILLCLLSPSTYKVQQSNSKLLRVAKQHSLALGVRLHFQSLRKEEQNGKSHESITFSL